MKSAASTLCSLKSTLLAVLWMHLFTYQLVADEVVVTDSRGKQITRRGKVLDYLGDQLTLETSAGRKIVIPTGRITKVEADWLPSHLDGDSQYAKLDFDAALTRYRQSFNDESRRWVKRKLLGRIVRCQRNTGRVTEACRNFAKLVSDDTETPYFNAIPLAWSPRQPSRDLVSLSRSWIGSENDPDQRLMAASWLLSSTTDRSTALKTLNELTRHPADRISHLATAQIWRTQIVTVKEPQLDNWSRIIRAMPVALRGGPYYLLGKAHARFDRSDDAVLAWMRLPTTYAEDFPLVTSSLFASAKLLQESGHITEAIRLYRETIRVGGESLEAMRARQQLSSLVN